MEDIGNVESAIGILGLETIVPSSNISKYLIGHINHEIMFT